MTNGDDMAFPNVVTDAEGNNVDYEKGVSKREYFAAMAMQGICSSNYNAEYRGLVAIQSVELADALIKWLNN